MQHYQLTRVAEADLFEIWRYTAKTLGKAQADRYFRSIEACCEDIAAGRVKSRQAVLAHKRVHSVRCGRHYIFFIRDNRPLVIAILHEKMDSITRLERRLSGD